MVLAAAKSKSLLPPRLKPTLRRLQKEQLQPPKRRQSGLRAHLIVAVLVIEELLSHEATKPAIVLEKVVLAMVQLPQKVGLAQ